MGSQGQGQASGAGSVDFQFAANTADLAEGSMLSVEIKEQTFLLVKTDGEIRALDGKCPHAGAPLAKGALCGKKIVCPWHMGSFHVETGAWLEPPALAGLRTYATELRGEQIYIDPVHPQAPPPAEPASGDRVPPTDAGPVVFVGAGAVASAAIVALRERDAERSIIVLDPRPSEPVDRTQISKNALAGKMPPEKTPLFNGEKTAALRFDRIAERAVALDTSAKRITTESGREIPYGDCVIAVGGIAKKGDFPGADLAGITVLRELGDLEAIRPFIAAAKHAVVLGTSFIAMEAASALRDANVEVTVVGRAGLPFEKQFGATVARAIMNLHESRGVHFMLGDEIRSASGDAQVRKVILQSGKEIACDVVITGYGVSPATDFLTHLPKNRDGGINVGADFLIAPHVYVGGDIAAAPTAEGTLRIEHWRLAQQHGYAIGARLAGENPGPFAKTPFFWSQQHGNRFAYVGHAEKWDDVIIDGDLAANTFVAYYVADGVVLAALTCKQERATAILMELLYEKPSLAAARAAVQ